MQHVRCGDLSVSVFGGWAEIGGNQILLEAEGQALLLDFGRSFNRWNRHFTMTQARKPTASAVGRNCPIPVT